MHFSLLTALTAAAATLVAAHPGEDHHAEMLERRQVLQHTRRDLSHCADKLRARGFEQRSLKRRADLASSLMAKRNLKRSLNGRDLDTVLNTSHESTEPYSLNTPETVLFSGNNSCILSPEVTQGPYYVSGERVRRNIVESQKGVPLTLDLQVLDVETCEPVPSVYLEIWHCNSTGVYSGVAASGNGNSDTVTSNLNATFMRGVQNTDGDGVAQFDSLVPGHYTGRATHIHIMVHPSGTQAERNGTMLNTTASHVGQIFFDQDLISQVEATSPYSTNTQELTTNAEDSILSEEAANGSDPFVEYVQLGDDIADGVLGWIAFGINTTLAQSITPAATYYAEGGEENPDSGMGGGGGSGSNSTAPSGVPGGTTLSTSVTSASASSA